MGEWTDCEHRCPRCWLIDTKGAFSAWLFRHMPLDYRHRRIMRVAMQRRRIWREAEGFGKFLADPREAHQMRRMMRALTKSMAPAYPVFRATPAQEAFYEGGADDDV